MSDSSLASFLGEVARSGFRRWCRSSLLAMLGTDLVLFLALRARLASLSVAVLTCCLLVGMVASLGRVSGMLLGGLRRPGVPPRGLRLVFRFVRSPRLLLLELCASFKFRLWLL